MEKDSINPGGFRSLLNFASNLDRDISDHLENTTVFKGHSATIQNEILECLLQIYTNKVISQVSEAPLIAIIADEITDVSVQNHLSLVIRYIYDYRIVEHWEFFQPDRVNADGIANVILTQLKKFFERRLKKVDNSKNY